MAKVFRVKYVGHIAVYAESEEKATAMVSNMNLEPDSWKDHYLYSEHIDHTGPFGIEGADEIIGLAGCPRHEGEERNHYTLCPKCQASYHEDEEHTCRENYARDLHASKAGDEWVRVGHVVADVMAKLDGRGARLQEEVMGSEATHDLRAWWGGYSGQ